MIREWPGSLTYVSSFGAESVAMLALIADVKPDLPVIFLETGMHFPQTLDYRDELTKNDLSQLIFRVVRPGKVYRYLIYVSFTTYSLERH